MRNHPENERNAPTALAGACLTSFPTLFSIGGKNRDTASRRLASVLSS